MYDTATVVKLTFNDLIGKVCKECETAQYEFSAPDYLFVSHHVARAHPELLESMLVLVYRSATVSKEQRIKWM